MIAWLLKGVLLWHFGSPTRQNFLYLLLSLFPANYHLFKVHFIFNATRHAILAVVFVLMLINASAQQKISGTVTGPASVPIAAATIQKQDHATATATDTNGHFTIMGTVGEVLIVSATGYKTSHVVITSQAPLKISLYETLVNLDEVVVTGYTSQRIKEITGAVAVVKPQDITDIPAGQVEQMLQGRVSGLNIITSGMPGGGSNVRLHGISNFGDVTPLYIIDGVQGNINHLNPNDIESLQVLKDAGAFAIYGVRGANGVIVITTRNGKQGKTKIDYDFYVGLTRPLKGLKILNPAEMAELTWLAKKNSGEVDPSTGNPVDFFYGNGAKPVLPDYFIDAPVFTGYMAGDPLVDPDLYNIDFTNGPIYQITPTNKIGTDWFGEIFKPALSQNHTITVSGANNKNKYLLSFGYLNQQGTLLNTHLKRYTTRVNTVFNINDHIRVGENLQLSYRDNPRISLQQALYSNEWNNEVYNALVSQPILPVYDIQTGWAHFFPFEFANNPVAQRTIAKNNKSHFWETFGNAFAEVDLLKYFSFRTSFGGSLTNRYTYNYSFTSYYPRTDSLPNNKLTESSGYVRSYTWTNTLSFKKTFKGNHHLRSLIGIEAIDNYNRETGGTRTGLFFDDIDYRFLSNGSPQTATNYSFASASTLYSLIGDANYAFREKYFFKTTLRRDGSSIFGPQNRYGWFPSFSAAWRLTEEKFMQPVQWLTDFKLRASWGKTGFYGNTDPNNQYTLYGGSIADAFYDIYGTNSPVRGFRAIRLGDPRTGWQEDVVRNVGFESVLWNGRLIITADWYNKIANGLLFPATLPDVAGGAQPPNVNVGKVKNSGLDLLIGSKGSFSKSFLWDATVTLTTYKNEIVKLADLPFFIPDFFSVGPIVRNEVGHPIGSFYGYKIVGLFKDFEDVSKSPMQNSAAPGRFKYLDANNDGEISDEDRVHFGDPNPNFTLGLNLSATYKQLDFSTFFYGSFGNDVMNLPRKMFDFFPTGVAGGIPSAKSKNALYHSWTPQRTSTSVPIAENNLNFSNVLTENSYPLEKGSYFRNKSIILGYSLPKTVLQKWKIERLRIYLQAVNLFTITGYTGLDPEISGQSDAFGIDFGNYPNNQKQYLFGLNIIL